MNFETLGTLLEEAQKVNVDRFISLIKGEDEIYSIKKVEHEEIRELEKKIGLSRRVLHWPWQPPLTLQGVASSSETFIGFLSLLFPYFKLYEAIVGPLWLHDAKKETQIDLNKFKTNRHGKYEGIIEEVGTIAELKEILSEDTFCTIHNIIELGDPSNKAWLNRYPKLPPSFEFAKGASVSYRAKRSDLVVQFQNPTIYVTHYAINFCFGWAQMREADGSTEGAKPTLMPTFVYFVPNNLCHRIFRVEEITKQLEEEKSRNSEHLDKPEG